MLSVRPQLQVAVFLLLISGCVCGEYKRVCYYANWSQYRPGIMRFVARNIDTSLCTHIVYAFAKVLPDTNTLGPTESNDEGLSGGYKQVTFKKETSPGLKVLLGVGGWTHSSVGFTDVVSTDGRIDTFCDNVITFLRERDFDGLDLDWEFPGQRGGPAGDRERYTKLVTRLRQKFDTEATTQTTKQRLILSASVSGSHETINSAYQVNIISGYLDFVSIMAYDYQGNWSSGIDHACPLYARTDQNPPQSYTNANYAVMYWISQGMSASKIVLGIPLYGKTFRLKNSYLHDIGDAFDGAGDDLPYYSVCSGTTSKPIYQYTYGWQEEQNASYAFNSELWVGYETQKSIEIKANYIKDTNLGGAMVFEISQDDFNGQFCNQGNYPLLNTLKQVLEFRKDQCQAGTYVNSLIYSCTDCPVDTYQHQVSQTECISCPTNTQTKSTRSTSSDFCHTPCPAGREFNTLTSACKPCPINYFQDGQPSSRHCIKCPPDTHTLVQGSSSCIPITDGKQPPVLDHMDYTLNMKFTTASCDRPELLTSSLQDEARKTMLLLNKQWEGLCNQNCDNVKVGSVVRGCQSTNRRRRAPTQIEMDLIFTDIPQELKQNVTFGSGETRSTQSILDDYFYDKTVFQSLVSKFGLTYDSIAKTDITLVCIQPGYILTNTMCEPCPVGTSKKLETCEPCGHGFYQDKTGSTTCNECPLYKTTNIMGATSPTQCFVQCPKGTRKDSGSCTECPVGFYQDRIDQLSCTGCMQYYTTNSTGATSFDNCFLKCPAGTKEESDTCVKCPVGEYQDQMSSRSCKSCQRFKTTKEMGSTSIYDCFLYCPVGTKELSNTCDECPLNFYQDETNQTTCKQCPEYKITTTKGATSLSQCILQCPAGTKTASGTCELCPVNYYQDLINQVTCKKCSDYHITQTPGAKSSSQCILHCEAGSKAEAGKCVPCPIGQYQNVAGSTSCKDCPDSMTTNSPGASSSIFCVDKPVQCPEGTKIVSGKCIECPLNYYQDKANQTECRPCEQYHITNSTGAKSADQCILQCPKGTKIVSGKCIECPLNFYQDQPNQVECRPCEQYHITNSPGATSADQCILHCSAGSKAEAGKCVPCPIGQYQDVVGSTSCKDCPDSMTTNSPGAASSIFCVVKGVQCPTGTKIVSGKCIECPLNYYQDKENQTECRPCEQYHITNNTGAKSADQCILHCSVGSKAEAGKCVPCPIGQYQDVAGSTSCKDCRDSMTTNSRGAASSFLCVEKVVQCPKGTKIVSGKCIDCPLNYYQDQLNQIECRPCEQYHITNSSGATSADQCILQCPAGTKEESGSCSKCPLSQYQDEISKSFCKNCPQYHTTSNTGAKSLSQCFLRCPAGTKVESGSCTKCPVGYYQDEVNKSSCKNCPQYTTSNIGTKSSSQCFLKGVQCPTGTKIVSGKCIECPLNYYQDKENQTECRPCEQYHITNSTGAKSADQCILHCSVGSKAEAGKCVPCPIGQYQDVAGSTSCKDCPDSMTTNSRGAAFSFLCVEKVVQCPKGTKIVSGKCIECPLNYYQDKANQTECRPCEQYHITNSPGATSADQCILQCPAGTKEESGSCSKCPLSQYQDEISKSFCKNCPQYHTTSNTGAKSHSQCFLRCPAGTKVESGSCTKCPVGQYQDEVNQSSCKNCPQYTTSNIGTKSSSQCFLQCPAGTKQESGSCTKCPLGQYQDEINKSLCKNCPQYKTTSSTGATSSTQCFLQCPAGTKEESGSCSKCHVGQYQDEISKSFCKNCPQYKTTNFPGSNSSSQCFLQCPAGTKQESGSCSKCPVGQYQYEISKSFCKNCPGYHTTSETGAKSYTQCFLQCPAGTKEESGSCSKCPLGQYQDEISKSFCKNCPQYKTTHVIGATSVNQCALQCPAGTKQESGSCTKCPVGQYQDEMNKSLCKNCPQYKTTSNTGATSSTQCFFQCPVGTKEESGYCTKCPVGQYQDEISKSFCKNCPQYKTTSNTGATASSQCFLRCPVGTKEESGSCSKCPVGQYQDEISKSFCKNCPQYKTSFIGATSSSQCFLQCPAGTKQESGSCSKCPVGQYQDEISKSSCKNCPQYKTTSNTGATSSTQCFLQCPAGMKGDAGTCVKCPLGQYQDGMGSTSCKTCPQYKTTSVEGTTSIDKCFLWCPVGRKGVMPDSCVKCPVGQYQDAAGSFSCKMCGQFKTTSSAGTTSPNQCFLQCPVGMKEESGTCSKCPVGQYQDELGKPTCKNCPQYKTTNDTASTSSSQCFFWCPVGRRLESETCVKCPVGEYQDVAGSRTCKKCAEFQTTNSDESISMDQCFILCPAGRKKESDTCVQCPIGQFQDESGKSACKPCGVNMITNQIGSTSQNQCILQCPAGTKEMSESCIPCPEGEYQDQIDSKSCKTCPTFKTTKTKGAKSLNQCVWNCPKGMREDDDSCILCPLGQYQDEVGLKICKSCPEYRTTNTTGSTSLNDCFPMCLAGTMGERGVCVKCPKGQFQDEIETTVCKACPKYRTTSSAGTKSLMECFLLCPVGMMESGGTCVECPVGQYQDETNSKSCKQCPQHSSMTTTGATSRDQCLVICPVGYKEDSGLCIKCPVSYYQDVAGSNLCKPCPQYMYTQSPGATMVVQCILRCPVGMKEESAQCLECPVDQYQDEVGKTICKNCPNHKRTNRTGASLPEHCLSPCEMSPNFCENGGTCLWKETDPTAEMTCICRTRFYGDHCEKYTDTSASLTAVVGGSVGGSLAFLLILMAILIACACWRFSKKEKSHKRQRSKSMDDIREGVYNPYFYMDGKYLNQPATVVELVEPTETSTDHSFKRNSSRSIYTRVTSQLGSEEHKNAVREVGNESGDDNTHSSSNEYKFGLPYVDFMNKRSDDGREDGPLMNGGGKFVRKIKI